MNDRAIQTEWESAVTVAELGGAPETDLHGRDVVDATMEIERFLAEAYRLGYPAVRIIHGRGTGTLQDATRALLARHPLVSYFRPSENPGEIGAVTYAAIAKTRV